MPLNKIRLGYNSVPAKAKKLVLEVFNSGQFSPGIKVREFEEKFAALHKAKHAVFVNSGTDALRLGLLALKEKYAWKDGDLVAVTTQTFVATVNVILQSGLTPFFYDNGNPWSLEHILNTSPEKPNIVAVMPVHLFGKPCDPRIYQTAKERGWKVLEDSCETILNPIRGNVSCHSTYMAHHLVTGVGGFVLTHDHEIADLIRSYANHGRNIAYLPGHRTPPLSKQLLQKRFLFERSGYSSRGTEFEAALGLSQLDDLHVNVHKRREVAAKLCKALWPWYAKFQMDEPNLHPRHTFMMFPMIAKEGYRFDKYKFCLHLEKRGIETRDLMPITSQPSFKALVKESDYPSSDYSNKNGFYLPINPGMTDRDIAQIRRAFKSYLQK